MTARIPVLVYAGQSNATLSFIEGHHSILLAKQDIRAVAIDTSVGSTGFSTQSEVNWNPFPDAQGKTGTLYVDMRGKIERVLKDLGAGNVHAVLWVSGETDAHIRSGEAFHAEYYRCLERVYLDICDAYGRDVRFVVQSLSSFAPRLRRFPKRFPNWLPIMEAQARLSDAYDGVRLIRADDLIEAQFDRPQDAFKDGLHYCWEANAVFAAEFIRLAFAPDA